MNMIICHSGGAQGADTFWENCGVKYGIKTNAYSYKTPKHKSINKVEISDDDYVEGIEQIKLANKFLLRQGINKYMNLLARNWAQVKYSKQIFAIGNIIKPGEITKWGYPNKSKIDVVDGGTGYAVMMGIINNREVFVYDQTKLKWFRWSYTFKSFVECIRPTITDDFAGIGTRDINKFGIEEIEEIYKQSFITI